MLMRGPILVVLAAGMGSRYGGLKQMDRIGKSGEVLLDYSVFDAKRAGFAKAVFIIRHDIEKDFRELVLSRIASVFPCDLAFQELDSIVPPAVFEESRKLGRSKPWGTAHALLCAQDKINAPFAIINADDFYGREAFEALGKYLNADISEGAIVPYGLCKTLSPQGTVTRGVCEIDRGFLVSADELTAIAREADGKIYNTGANGAKRYLPDDTPVSMNCWGFPTGIFPALRRYFDEFLAEKGKEPKSECYLPMAADWFVKNGALRIRVLEADSEWFGVTYKEDREQAVNRIEQLVEQGVYPPSLWGR
jgi:NDP-sugar pyrophosphorylase family protein